MRKQSLTLILLLASNFIFAQKELPSYGKIDKDDLLMKECEFDKDAEAYKLISFGDVNYQITGGEFNIVTERRVRIKILKEKGLDKANIKLRFYNKLNYENINSVSGITYNLDNSEKIVTTRLEKSSVYTKKINNQVSEVSFTLPGVKVGSVIEYKFTETKKSIANLDDWYFQDDIPTRTSIYRILVPSIFKFVTQLLTYQQIDQKSEDINQSIFYEQENIKFVSSEKTYTMRDVPALRDEPYMGAPKDYLQRIIFQLSRIEYPNGREEGVMSTWPKLTKELLDDKDFGLQLKKNLPHTKLLDDSLKNVKDDYNKMLVIHGYVRKNMNWDGRESIYSTDGIKSAWDKKSGNNSELNFVLIDLLRDAGLHAYPLLVSTKDNGIVNPIYPFLQQFNNVITLVIIGEKRYVLNAADKYNPSYLIPYDVLDNDALIVDEKKGGWIRLEDKENQSKNVVLFFAQVSPDAEMKGQATVYSYGYSKNPKVKKWKEEKSTFKDNFKKEYTGMTIETLQVKNEDIDTLPLEQKIDFSLPLNSSGEYKYFTLNLFQGLEKNPFIADKRNTDIDFDYRQSYLITGKVIIPDNYEFEELPKSIKMIMPDTSIVLKRMIQRGENSIDFRISLDFSRSFYSVDIYPDLQEFYKELFNALNEQIVIKKKNVNS
ncbi:MAG: DUF3857 domain-containing protein [Ginsengibacter sp.]